MSEPNPVSSVPAPATPPAPAPGPAVLWLDPAGRIAAVNASARRLWQAGETELIGEHFATLFVFDIVSSSADWLEAQWDVLLAAALDQSIPLKAQPREGAAVDVRLRIEKITAASPGYSALIETGAPPVRAEASAAPAPADSRSAGLALLAEKGAGGFFDLNFRANQAFYAPAWKKILGYVDAELPNTYDTWIKLLHPEDSGAAPDKLARKALPGSRPFAVEFRMKHRLGHDVWIQSTGLQQVGEDGKLERVLGMNLDITERKELEEASLTGEERLGLLADAEGSLPAFDLDFSRNRHWFSQGWRSRFSREEAALDQADDFLNALPHAEREAGVSLFFLGRAVGQASFTETATFLDRDGHPVPVLLGVHRQLNRKRELVRVTGFAVPLPAGTGATPAPAAGSLGSEAGAALLAALAEGAIVTDARGKIAEINSAASRLLQLAPDKARGQPLAEVFRLVDRQSARPAEDVIDRVLAADGPLPLISDHAVLPFAGPAADKPAPLPVVWTARAALDSGGRPLGVAVVFRDPEEMRLTPEELVKANRFEALGLLAGGIAHDFNNLLTTILGGVSLAKDNRDYSALDDAEKSCLTAKGLTKQLLLFAKGGTGTQIVAAPKEIVDDTIKIAAAGSTAVVTTEIAPDVGPVLVDRAQILQVFQNLVVNALQAMPPAPHQARIHVQVGNVTLTEGQMPPLAAGNYVSFAVRDNGSGIKPEHLEKIWDPFFTTKKHGTGLGLATVLSIVRKHGGQIGLETQVGAGTAFTVVLPLADQPVEVQARKAASLRFGTGRVLLMDDDAKIAALTSNMLESLDYKFDVARNGEEAIALYKRYLNIGRPYDAVIMDLTVIGGMGGEECFGELKKLDPEVRAIVSSGYDNEEMARQFLDKGFCGYLTKPYRVTDLGKVLKAVLG